MTKRRPQFMIHKHQATHLHYDLRLEVGGVLVSWALKDIPVNPEKPVLAIRVNDHPFWYRHFEGVIPEGSYGAGPVMVWDKGLYSSFFRTPQRTLLSPEESLKDGVLMIWLSGKKLKGGYILVRTSRKQRWLMIKMADEYAITKGRKPSNWKYSVKSGKTLDQIFQKYSNSHE